MDDAVLGSADDQPLAVDGRGEVVAGTGDLVDPADAEPVVIEEGTPFELEELIGRVARRRQGAGLVDIEHRVIERGQELGGQHGLIGHRGPASLGDVVSEFGSFNKNLRILPTLVRGSSATKEMSRGCFDFANRSEHQSSSC